MTNLNKILKPESEAASTGSKKNIADFPIELIDTTWMNVTQKRLFEVLKNPENRSKHYTEILKLAGYKSIDAWHRSFRTSERFAELIESMGVTVKMQSSPYPAHHKIQFIKNPSERLKHLNGDHWDMRLLFEEFPRHSPPVVFQVDFEKIQNPNIRKTVKKYFIEMLSTWKPSSFRWALGKLMYFISPLEQLFPEIDSFKNLERRKHIEPILHAMICSNDSKKESLNIVKSMFRYMYDYRWEGAPPSDTLIISYDVPKGNNTLPKPIPPFVKKQFDDYICQTIVPLLEENKPTPILDPFYWDWLIVIRYTGRRIEDMSHLISDNSDTDCLQYDQDGDPLLYVDHRIAKIEKDLYVTLALYNNYTPYGNIVERAIIRQKKRVKDLPPAPDGYKYLFRIFITDKRGKSGPKKVLDSKGNAVVDVLPYHSFNKLVFNAVCKGIPLKTPDGTIYKITSHKFRHTVATEMIDAGIDPLAVKEFLGHTSLAMTERYVQIYKETIKKVFMKKLSDTNSSMVLNSLPDNSELYISSWVKNKLIAVFDLGDGCCEHPYKIPSCPHMVCKTCIKKKIYPRHMQAVKDTIECYTAHRDNTLDIGLEEKAKEFDKVVIFYSKALEIISQGEVFEASKHF